MDISNDKYKPDRNRPGYLLAGWQKIRDLFKWLIGIYELTEEERLTAGIHISDEERE